MSQIRVLSQQDVLSLMTVKDAILADENAYLQKAKGTGSVWPMVFHEFDPGKADLDIKSGDLKDDSVFGFKLVSWYGENPARGLPELYGTSMLFDLSSGAPVALINAGALTGMRTGAAAAVGAKYLANPGSKVLLVVGTGHVSPYAVAATLIACPTIETVLWNNPRHPERIAERVAELCDAVKDMLKTCGEECHAEILPAPDIARAASRADVILTATPAREPVLRREWIRPGTHISCVGADMSGKQELDSDIIAAAAVFVDDQTQSTTVGECEIPIKTGRIAVEHLRGEIGDVIRGTKGRTSETDITVFDSSGIALQDLACCAGILRKAEELNIGLTVKI